MAQTFYVIVRGPLGAGKTTVSKELSRRYNAIHISIEEILEKFNLEEWEHDHISETSFLSANEIAVKEAKEYLYSGKPVIFDGDFYFRQVVVGLTNGLSKFRRVVITLTLPLVECIRRDASRSLVLGEEGTRMVYKKSTEFRIGTEVNASKSLNEVVASISGIIGDKLE